MSQRCSVSVTSVIFTRGLPQRSKLPGILDSPALRVKPPAPATPPPWECSWTRGPPSGRDHGLRVDRAASVGSSAGYPSRPPPPCPKAGPPAAVLAAGGSRQAAIAPPSATAAGTSASPPGAPPGQSPVGAGGTARSPAPP